MVRLKALDGKDTSPLCFGCMQFGGTADAAASRAMFDACRDAGINFFDTVHTYTGGQSEESLGGFIKQDRWLQGIEAIVQWQQSMMTERNHHRFLLFAENG